MSSDAIQSAIAKANEYNLRLDRALGETGVVSRALFTDFAAVQSDPNASSVGWLEAKLRVLSVRVSSGASLELYEPRDDAFRKVDTHQEFIGWAKQHFPIADIDPGRRTAQ
jgi:hypothetical protein